MTGRIWSALLTMLLVPVYIRFVGLEAYGLIGFYTMLLASLAILDLGLSTTLNRELALSKARNKDPHQVRSLVLTLERIYWAIGLVIALLVVLFSNLIASRWINAENLSQDTIRNSILLMGAVIAFQWPISLYTGGMLGLEKQVLYNVLLITLTTLRAAGVLLVFLFVEPSLELFFIWQVIISFIYVLFMRAGVWKHLPHSDMPAIFSTEQLKNVWRFATGMTGIGVTAFLLAQVDKVLLSKILPLTHYAYYTVAVTLASVLGTFITPVFAAAFPRFTAFITTHDTESLQRVYHSSSKLVATILFPIGLFVIFFAPEILGVWTNSPDTVAHAAVLVQVLTTAGILSGLASIPFLLVQAHGNTRFLFLQNLIAVIVIVPLIFFAAYSWGALGAALVLVLIYSLYVFVSVPVINHRYFKGQSMKWFLDDTFIPMIPPLLILTLVRLILNYYLPGKDISLTWIIFLALFTGFVSSLFNTEIREMVFHFLKRRQQIKSVI
jgi:O-antigen/teichoic acid export membrane protein